MRIKWRAGAAANSPRRAARRLVLLLLLVALCFGFTMWRHPLWLFDRQTDARLRFHGVRSEYVTVQGYKLHYLVGGSGRPLILVHGLGSRAADWANLIPQLIAGGYRIYAIDLLGYGRSAQPKDASYSIAQQASIVEGFLDSQHLELVDLAGWSMGGWVAMKVALQQPERIRRLVLLDSAGLRFKLGIDPEGLTPHSPAQLAALEGFLVPNPRPLPGFLATAMLRRSERTSWVVRRSLQSMMGGDDLLDGKLSALTMPVLIGWGEQDKLIPLEIGYQLHAQILQSALDIYVGCGHLAPEQCTGQVAPGVVEFLNAQPAHMATMRRIPAAAGGN